MKFTEAALLEALRVRHSVTGNGGAGRYAFLTHVRTGAAWEQQEIDAVVVCLWPSDGHDLHAFEIKCSRGDWKRELHRGRAKSVRTRMLADTFTVVAPRGVVELDDLPEGWGLLEAHREDDGERDAIKLRQRVKATPLHVTYAPSPVPRSERTFDRGLVVAMLRAAGAVPGMTSGKKRKGTNEAA